MNRRYFIASLAAIALPVRATAPTEVLEGRAFAGSMSTQRFAGLYSLAQLWNPPGSGRLCIITGVTMDNPESDAPFGVELKGNGTPLATLQGNPKNRIVGAPDSVMQLRVEAVSNYPLETAIFGFPHLSQRMKSESFPFDAILLPGTGMLFAPEMRDVRACITWSHYEQAV